MPRYAAKITPQDLLQKVLVAGRSDEWMEGDRFDPYGLFENCPTVEKDLEKVEFDFENFEFEQSAEYGDWVGLLGPRTLGTLSYVGFCAGGDWEWPIYFIVYLDQDGKTLRGYIPRKGNTWNTKNKKAVGNDEDADELFKKKVLGDEFAEPSANKQDLEQEIINRIEVK